jgi:hypothetical protein
MGKLRRHRADPARWVVLLTTSVRGDEPRRELYARQIRRWLDETEFFIFVIESSDHAFPEIAPHERLRVVSFGLPEGLPSSSQYEARSILHFLDAVRDDPVFAGATHVFKATGRYFLEGVSDELRRVAGRGADYYLQERRNDYTRWQNSEYFGIRKELLGPMVSPIVEHGLMEPRLHEASRQNGLICFLRPFPNRVARGGDGLVLEPL